MNDRVRVKCFVVINQVCGKARTEIWISNQYTVMNQHSIMFCIFVFNTMYLLGGLFKKNIVCFKCDSHQNQTFYLTVFFPYTQRISDTKPDSVWKVSTIYPHLLVHSSM